MTKNDPLPEEMTSLSSEELDDLFREPEPEFVPEPLPPAPKKGIKWVRGQDGRLIAE